ncbi:MAG: hypothetical protein P1P90_00645 [Patescibacteria group bacterium]|nr:hypothetical protein [Patescibacteria group bacterium]
MEQSKIAEINSKLDNLTTRSADVFDIDGTVFKGRLLLNLVEGVCESMGPKKPERQAVRSSFELWRYGKLTTQQLFSQVVDMVDCGFFVGLPKSEVEIIASRAADKCIGLRNLFAFELIQCLRKRPTKDRRLIIAITGSPEEIVLPYCKHMGFDVVISSYYHTDIEGNYIFERNLEAAFKKAAIMDTLQKDCGISWKGAIGAGDTGADIGALDFVEYPIAVNPDTKLLEHVRKNNQSIAVVYDSPKKGVQLFKSDKEGRLHEACLEKVLPLDIAEKFPKLPGMI